MSRVSKFVSSYIHTTERDERIITVEQIARDRGEGHKGGYAWAVQSLQCLTIFDKKKTLKYQHRLKNGRKNLFQPTLFKGIKYVLINYICLIITQIKELKHQKNLRKIGFDKKIVVEKSPTNLTVTA